jgi:hypothetical protein
MRWRFSLFALLTSLMLLCLAGCGPKLSKQDLGTVVFEVPKVAGAQKPYQLPQLGPPKDPDKRPARRRLR